MKEQPNKTTVKDGWKLTGHSYQIADTGDYDGHYEITNGKISLLTQDDDDESLQPIVDALNNSGCKFYQNDWFEFENKMLKDENAELTRQVAALTHQRDLYRKKFNESKGVHIAKDLGIPENIEMAPIVQSDTDELRERVKELEAWKNLTRGLINEIENRQTTADLMHIYAEESGVKEKDIAVYEAGFYDGVTFFRRRLNEELK